MNQIEIKARAKINLTLNVLHKRQDGYHNLESVFQKVDIYDEIKIEKILNDEFEFITNEKSIENEENIIYKAFVLLKQKYSITGVKVTLQKNIPMQAGMAGGSTDAASFIAGINQLFELNLTQEQMNAIGVELGADVIPCFYEGAIKAEGIGEKVTPIFTDFKYDIVIIKPPFSCHTGKMYQKLDEMDFIQKYQANRMIQALETKDIYLLANSLYNVFEEAVEANQISYYKKLLEDKGAIR